MDSGRKHESYLKIEHILEVVPLEEEDLDLHPNSEITTKGEEVITALIEKIHSFSLVGSKTWDKGQNISQAHGADENVMNTLLKNMKTLMDEIEKRK